MNRQDSDETSTGQDGRLLRDILDALPAAVLLMDADRRVLDMNRAAEDLFEREFATHGMRLCGETIHCVHVQGTSSGCGDTPSCPDCVLRKAVQTVCEGGRVHRERAEVELVRDGECVRFYFLVTAVPFPYDHRNNVLMVLEDVTAMVELRRMLSICAGCKKIRRDDQLWEQIESYLQRHANLDFSHGICPQCARELYPELCPEKTDGEKTHE